MQAATTATPPAGAGSTDEDLERIRNIVVDEIRKNADWIGVRWAKPEDASFGRDTRLLEYACGQATITSALADRVTEVVGVDPERSGVDAFTSRCRTSTITTMAAPGAATANVSAYSGDLLAGAAGTSDAPLADAKFFEFDLAAIGLGFSRFDDPKLLIKRVVERLKWSTGVLLIAATLPCARESDSVAHFASALKSMFVDAGIEDYAHLVSEASISAAQPDGTQQEMTLILARGTKAPGLAGKLGRWLTAAQLYVAENSSFVPSRIRPERPNVNPSDMRRSNWNFTPETVRREGPRGTIVFPATANEGGRNFNPGVMEERQPTGWWQMAKTSQ